MRKALFQLFGLLAAVATILSACNMPSANATAEGPAQTESPATDAVTVIDLAATQTRPVEVVPTNTPDCHGHRNAASKTKRYIHPRTSKGTGGARVQLPPRPRCTLQAGRHLPAWSDA